MKTKSTLKQSISQYAFIFEHFDDFVSIVNANNRIVEYANKVALEMFEIKSEEELVGKTIPNFRKIALTNEKIESIMDFVKDGSQYREEVEFVTTKGKEFWGLMRANILIIDNVNYVIYKITDISDLKRIQKENTLYHQRLKFAIEGNGDGLWDWHIPTNNTYFSKSWKLMLGFEEHELANNFDTWRGLVHPDDIDIVLSKIDEYIKHPFQNTYDVEFRMICKNGDYKWINARGMIVENDNSGNPVRFVGTHSDIDKLKTIQEDLKLYANRLEKSNEDIKHFAYITTHDLKEPLRTISNNIQILKLKNKTALDTDSLQLIDYSVDGCKKLMGIIKELLDYAQLDLGENDLEIVNLNDVAQTVIGNLEQYLMSKNTTIELKTLPTNFIGHKIHMSRLLQNLIANGIKYNDKKNPKIVLDCTQIDNNYVISIADNGIGISKEYNTKVYEIFKRLKTDNDSESVGMGLAVCKKIVEAHKGKIWHESQVGEGTTFYINLPLQRA